MQAGEASAVCRDAFVVSAAVLLCTARCQLGPRSLRGPHPARPSGCAVCAEVEHPPHLVGPHFHKLAKGQVTRQAIPADTRAPQAFHLKARVLDQVAHLPRPTGKHAHPVDASCTHAQGAAASRAVSLSAARSSMAPACPRRDLRSRRDADMQIPWMPPPTSRHNREQAIWTGVLRSAALGRRRRRVPASPRGCGLLPPQRARGWGDWSRSHPGSPPPAAQTRRPWCSLQRWPPGPGAGAGGSE